MLPLLLHRLMYLLVALTMLQVHLRGEMHCLEILFSLSVSPP